MNSRGASNSQGASMSNGPSGTLKNWEQVVAGFGRQDQWLIGQ
jgi:hypothetical protein